MSLRDKPKIFGELAAKFKPGDDECWFNVEPLLHGAARITITDGANVSAFWDYPYVGDALVAINKWDGNGDPPGPWCRASREGGQMFKRSAYDKLCSVEESFESYATHCYSHHWKSRLPFRQLTAIKQAFISGYLAAFTDFDVVLSDEVTEDQGREFLIARETELRRLGDELVEEQTAIKNVRHTPTEARN